MDAVAVPDRRPPDVRRRVARGVSPLLRLAAWSLLVVSLAAALLWRAGVWEPGAIRIRLSEPYAHVTELARRDPTVARELGPVRRFGWLPRGELEAGPREGWCELEVFVRGERRSGTLEARLERRGGQWFWRWANLRLPDGRLLALAVP